VAPGPGQHIKEQISLLQETQPQFLGPVRSNEAIVWLVNISLNSLPWSVETACWVRVNRRTDRPTDPRGSSLG